MNIIMHRYFTLSVTLLTSLLALLSSLLFEYEFLFKFVDEGGFIESITLVFYAIAALFVLFYPHSYIKKISRLSIAILMLAMLAREADLHKILGMSMLKIKFWLTAESSLMDKLVAAIILLFLLFTLIQLAKSSLKIGWKDLKQRQAYAITLVIFFVVLVIAKIFDRSVNMIYEMTGWIAPVWVIAIQLPQEEYLECLLPLLVIIAVIQYGQYQKLNAKC